MKNNFEKGQLIVPSDNLEIAFYFDPNTSELYDDIDYRVATDRERINYDKNIINNFEPLVNYNKFIKSKNKQVNDAHKSRTDEIGKFRSLINLHRTKGREK